MNFKTVLNVLFIFLFTLIYQVSGGKVFNVLQYGAVGNNRTDNTQAFMKAWKDACGWRGKSTFLIPRGTYYLGSVLFIGPCKGPMDFVIQGVLRAPTEPNAFLNKGDWITFRYLKNLKINGGGKLDGQGASAWPLNNCQTGSCSAFPTSLRLDFVNNSSITNINSINSKNIHFVIFACYDFNVTQVTLSAPGTSPNTDGIHVGASTKVNISSAVIGTGDDCISILEGSRGISISNVTCGPGHGISIGSLGKSMNEKEFVSDVTVKNCTFDRTLNGVQIKTWPEPNSAGGSVTHLIYDDIVMKDVDNPIFINQIYCPNNLCSLHQSRSKIQISGVRFSNIRGKSSTNEAVKLVCSRINPCRDIELVNINLRGPLGKTASANCSNAYGRSRGSVRPPSCLL